MITPKTKAATVTIDGRPVPIEGERNLLELVRRGQYEVERRAVLAALGDKL